MTEVEPVNSGDKLSFSSPSFDPEEYAKTARMARLETIRLLDSRYSASPQGLMDGELGDVKLQQGFGGEPSGHHFDVSTGVVIGGYRWSAEVKQKRKKIISLRVDFMLAYSGLEEAQAEYVSLYFNKVARFTTYPFFRSHFAVHASASCITLPPLPSLFERVD
jgi:hypothetical protein